MTTTSSLRIQADPQLRGLLLDYYLQTYDSVELSDWLEGLGQDKRGSVEAKCERIRAHTQYLNMDPTGFPDQTLNYLQRFESGHLEDLCDVLGVPSHGSKDQRLRRIMREVRYRESWIDRPNGNSGPPSVTTVRAFIEWYPIQKRGRYEKDFYPAFADEMDEVFGQVNVHEQLPIAFGSTLKIDFHLGHPQGDGVGVEFKMPTNNAEIQRGLGQLDQYQARYSDRLILVLFPDFLDRAQQVLFVDTLATRGVTVITK